MNKIIFSFCIVSAIACNYCMNKPLQKKGNPSGNSAEYNNLREGAFEVYKIDSVDNFYLIYAKKDGWEYKILSEKSNGKLCNELVAVNKKFDFKLRSAKEVTVGAADSIRNVYLFNVSCLVYNDTTEICIEHKEGMIAGLFIADNIRGLCLQSGKQ